MLQVVCCHARRQDGFKKDLFNNTSTSSMLKNPQGGSLDPPQRKPINKTLAPVQVALNVIYTV